MAPPRGKYQIKLNAVMFSMMLEELLSGPVTLQGLADYTGMSLLTVQRTIRVMHRRKLVHIAAWEQSSRGAWEIRVFGWGDKRDVKRPPPRTSTEHEKNRQARIAAATLAGGFTAAPAANEDRRAA